MVGEVKAAFASIESRIERDMQTLAELRESIARMRESNIDRKAHVFPVRIKPNEFTEDDGRGIDHVALRAVVKRLVDEGAPDEYLAQQTAEDLLWIGEQGIGWADIAETWARYQAMGANEESG